MNLREEKKASTQSTLAEKPMLQGDDLFVTDISAQQPKQGGKSHPLPASIRQQLDAIPDVRMEKVNAIKQQIENGTYDFSSEKLAKVADSLIESEDLSLGLFN